MRYLTGELPGGRGERVKTTCIRGVYFLYFYKLEYAHIRFEIKIERSIKVCGFMACLWVQTKRSY